jgi:hypothetical protein
MPYTGQCRAVGWNASDGITPAKRGIPAPARPAALNHLEPWSGQIKCLARLRFTADGPTVEGEWTLGSTAHDRYTEWVGLYSKTPSVVLRLDVEALCAPWVRCWFFRLPHLMAAGRV